MRNLTSHPVSLSDDYICSIFLFFFVSIHIIYYFIYYFIYQLLSCCTLLITIKTRSNEPNLLQSIEKIIHILQVRPLSRPNLLCRRVSVLVLGKSLRMSIVMTCRLSPYTITILQKRAMTQISAQEHSEDSSARLFNFLLGQGGW